MVLVITLTLHLGKRGKERRGRKRKEKKHQLGRRPTWSRGERGERGKTLSIPRIPRLIYHRAVKRGGERLARKRPLTCYKEKNRSLPLFPSFFAYVLWTPPLHFLAEKWRHFKGFHFVSSYFTLSTSSKSILGKSTFRFRDLKSAGKAVVASEFFFGGGRVSCRRWWLMGFGWVPCPLQRQKWKESFFISQSPTHTLSHTSLWRVEWPFLQLGQMPPPPFSQKKRGHGKT